MKTSLINLRHGIPKETLLRPPLSPLQLIEFPGMYVMLRKGEPSGGSVGSTVNHFGLQVRKLKDWLPKWQAAGVRMEPITRSTQVYLLTPDDVRVEILEEPSLSTPIAGHHIHFATQDIPGIGAWYVKTFGGVPGKRAIDTPPVTTKGRALDHIGFEVRNLPAFVAKLEAAARRSIAPTRNSELVSCHSVLHRSLGDIHRAYRRPCASQLNAGSAVPRWRRMPEPAYACR